MKIKFTNSQSLYDYDFERIGFNLIQLSHPAIKKNVTGFRVLNDMNQELYIFDDFIAVYDMGDGYIQYTDIIDMYYVFAVCNSKGYVKEVVSSTEPEMVNGYLMKCGQGKEFAEPDGADLFDDEGIYNYKVEDGKVVEVSSKEKQQILADKTLAGLDEVKNSLEAARKAKLDELSKECSVRISNGVWVEGEHYTYDLTDQNDIKTCVEMAAATGLDIPYHATDLPCRLYTAEEIAQIYVAQETNLTHQTTYHNQLKLYTMSLSTKEEIEKITYGQELEGEYLNTYNMVMAQAGKIIQVYIGGGADQ